MNIIKNLKQDLEAVSPVIGVILMVAITVVMAAVIGMFVFDVMPDEATPVANINIIVEDNRNFRVEHLGGDAIPNFYDGVGGHSYGWDNDWDNNDWVNMKVQINGKTVGIFATHASVEDLSVTPNNEYNNDDLTNNPLTFNSGDILRFKLDGTPNFKNGDIITVLHVPSGQILAREVVVL